MKTRVVTIAVNIDGHFLSASRSSEYPDKHLNRLSPSKVLRYRLVAWDISSFPRRVLTTDRGPGDVVGAALKASDFSSGSGVRRGQENTRRCSHAGERVSSAWKKARRCMRESSTRSGVQSRQKATAGTARFISSSPSPPRIVPDRWRRLPVASTNPLRILLLSLSLSTFIKGDTQRVSQFLPRSDSTRRKSNNGN